MATATMTVATPYYSDDRGSPRSPGGIPAHRVLLDPMPGTATERDVIELQDRANRLFELVDGTLVEKVMGFDESICAVLLVGSLIGYLKTHDLGKVIGDGGMVRLFPGMVRVPDTAFISWARYPKGKRKRGAIPTVVADLIVEVLSKGNTSKEMARKLREDQQLDGGDVLSGFSLSIRDWSAEAERTEPRRGK